MKPILFFILVGYVLSAQGQKIYTTSGGEIIFQSALVESANEDMNTNLRFTMAFHFGEFVHADLGNNFGFFSGLTLRNIGFITEENDIKRKFRSYNLGIPLAVKIGSFRKNLYVFGGGEYEWMIHFKQKVFLDEGKFKYASWFSKRTPAFIPSVFAGFQFPQGFQLKFKYYLNDFLNHHFVGGDAYNNYTAFNRSQVWYISLSYLIKNKRKNEQEPAPVEVAYLIK